MNINNFVLFAILVLVFVASYIRGMMLRKQHLGVLVLAEAGDANAIAKIRKLKNEDALFLKKCDRPRVIVVMKNEEARLAKIEDDILRAEELGFVDAQILGWTKPDKTEVECVELIFRYLVVFIGKLKYEESKIRAIQRFKPEFVGHSIGDTGRLLWMQDAQERFSSACARATNDDKEAFVVARTIRDVVKSNLKRGAVLALQYPDNWDHLVVYYMELPNFSDFMPLRSFTDLPRGKVSMHAAEGVAKGDLVALLQVMAYCGAWRDCRTEVGDVLYADVVREVKRIRSRAGSLHR